MQDSIGNSRLRQSIAAQSQRIIIETGENVFFNAKGEHPSFKTTPLPLAFFVFLLSKKGEGDCRMIEYAKAPEADREEKLRWLQEEVIDGEALQKISIEQGYWFDQDKTYDKWKNISSVLGMSGMRSGMMMCVWVRVLNRS